VPVLPTELAGLELLVQHAGPGDVIGVMCHAERTEIAEWLRSQGASGDTPESIRGKVLAAWARPVPQT